MRFKNLLIVIAIAIFCFTGCKTGPKISSETAADIAAITDSAALISPAYAKGFSVQYLEDGIRLVDIQLRRSSRRLKWASRCFSARKI